MQKHTLIIIINQSGPSDVLQEAKQISLITSVTQEFNSTYDDTRKTQRRCRSWHTHSERTRAVINSISAQPEARDTKDKEEDAKKKNEV